MSEQEDASLSPNPEEKYQNVVDFIVQREPKIPQQMVEFLTRLDMQYSGLYPSSTLLTNEELARTVHMDVISNKKVNIMTMKVQAEFRIHILEGQKEISDWVEGELERQLELFLSDLSSEKDGHQNVYFYHALAEIFLHVYTLKNYVLEEVRAALETLMPREDLKKFFYLDIKGQVRTVKYLFNRALGCILLFNPQGRLAAEFTGMYLALCDLQVLLTAELESEMSDSKMYIGLIQKLLDHHQMVGAYDVVFAESHALLTLHLQLMVYLGQMMRQVLCSKARLEIFEFRVDTLGSELALDRSHHATGDAPDSMLVNLNELGCAFNDIYCEFLIMSNINGVFARVKNLEEEIVNSLHEQTFSQIFEQPQPTPMVVSRVPSQVDCEPPELEALYEAPWQPYSSGEPLALNGICVVSVLDKKSYLKEGDLKLGVCKWKGKCYALSCPEAMDQFGKDPRLYADIVHRVGHDYPELIFLLDLQDEFPHLDPILKLRNPIHMMTCSKTCWAKAERLPEEEELARAWSEWDKPLVLDTQYETKNIGAYPSDVQRDKDTQCAPKVDSEMQTMSDVSINTDSPVIKSPRLLSHLNFKPYWVESVDLRGLQSKMENLSSDWSSEWKESDGDTSVQEISTGSSVQLDEGEIEFLEQEQITLVETSSEDEKSPSETVSDNS